jgi:hypothetical protein
VWLTSFDHWAILASYDYCKRQRNFSKRFGFEVSRQSCHLKVNEHIYDVTASKIKTHLVKDINCVISFSPENEGTRLFAVLQTDILLRLGYASDLELEPVLMTPFF